MDIDPDKARQLLEWLEGEDARVRAERIESGELVEVPLYIRSSRPRPTSWQNCTLLAISGRWCSA
jgi:hypothetical protein